MVECLTHCSCVKDGMCSWSRKFLVWFGVRTTLLFFPLLYCDVVQCTSISTLHDSPFVNWTHTSSFPIYLSWASDLVAEWLTHLLLCVSHGVKGLKQKAPCSIRGQVNVSANIRFLCQFVSFGIPFIPLPDRDNDRTFCSVHQCSTTHIIRFPLCPLDLGCVIPIYLSWASSSLDLVVEWLTWLSNWCAWSERA